MNQRDKADWYAANIAHTVACSFGGAKTKIQDHLLSFSQPDTQQYDPEESKAKWLAALGIKL